MVLRARGPSAACPAAIARRPPPERPPPPSAHPAAPLPRDTRHQSAPCLLHMLLMLVSERARTHEHPTDATQRDDSTYTHASHAHANVTRPTPESPARTSAGSRVMGAITRMARQALPWHTQASPRETAPCPADTQPPSCAMRHTSRARFPNALDRALARMLIMSSITPTGALPDQHSELRARGLGLCPEVSASPEWKNCTRVTHTCPARVLTMRPHARPHLSSKAHTLCQASLPHTLCPLAQDHIRVPGGSLFICSMLSDSGKASPHPASFASSRVPYGNKAL